MTRKNSTGINRPSLPPAVSRPQSGDFGRPRIPVKSTRARSSSQSASRPNSPRSNSAFLIQRARRSGDSVSSSSNKPPTAASSPARPPPLMLPPPEPTTHPIIHVLSQPTTVAGVRAAAFFVKLITLSLPCAPYAANAWLFYPLLALAASDVALLPFDPGRSVALFALHVAVLVFAHRQKRLCEGEWFRWDGY